MPEKPPRYLVYSTSGWTATWDGTSAGWKPRSFCSDPAAWGWLLEIDRIDVEWLGFELAPDYPWKAYKDGKEAWAETPARAVAIAFLESRT